MYKIWFSEREIFLIMFFFNYFQTAIRFVGDVLLIKLINSTYYF